MIPSTAFWNNLVPKFFPLIYIYKILIDKSNYDLPFACQLFYCRYRLHELYDDSSKRNLSESI